MAVTPAQSTAVRLGLQASPEHFDFSQGVENQAAAGEITGSMADYLKGQNLMETGFSPAIAAMGAYPYQIGQEVFRDVRDQGIGGIGSGFLRGAQAGWNNLRGIGAGIYDLVNPAAQAQVPTEYGSSGRVYSETGKPIIVGQPEYNSIQGQQEYEDAYWNRQPATVPRTLPANPVSQLMTTGALLRNEWPGFKEDISTGISEFAPQGWELNLPPALREGVPRAAKSVGGFLRNLIPGAEAAQTRLPGMRPIQPAPSWEDTSALREALKGVAFERDSTEKIDALRLDLGKAIVADPEKFEDYIKYIDPQIDVQTGLPSQERSAAEYRDYIKHNLENAGVDRQHIDALAAMRGAQGTLPKLAGIAPSGVYTQSWQNFENLIGREGAAEQAKDIANIEQGKLFQGRDISPWDMLYGRQMFEREYGSPYSEERFKGTELLPYPVLERYVEPKVDFAQLVSHTDSGVGGDEVSQYRNVMPWQSGEELMREEGITNVTPWINPFAEEAPDDLMVEDILREQYNPRFIDAQELIPDLTPEKFDDFVTSSVLGIDIPQAETFPPAATPPPPTPPSEVEDFSAIQEANQQRMEREAAQVRADNQRRENEAREAQDRARQDREKQERQARERKQEAKDRENRIREESRKAKEAQLQADDRKAIARARADAERAEREAEKARAKERQATIQRQEDQRRREATERAAAAAEKKKVDALLAKQMEDMMRSMEEARRRRYTGGTGGALMWT